MATTAADLLAGLKKGATPNTPGQAPDSAQAPQETTQSPAPTTTPTTQTNDQGQTFTQDEGDPSKSHVSLLGRLAGNLGDAAAERTGLNAGARLATGKSNAPLSDTLSAGTGAAVTGLIAAAPFTGGATLLPAATLAAAPVVGSLLEGTANTAGADSGLSRALGSIGEFLTGGYQALGGPREIAATGKAMLEGGTAALKRLKTVRPGELSYQNMGRLLSKYTASTLGRIKAPLSREIELAERGAQKIDVMPGQPGYQEAGFLTDLAGQRGVAHPALERIQTALDTNLPVKGADVLEVRKALGKMGGGAKNGLDPTVPVSAQDRTAVRQMATDVVRSFLAPADAAKYGTALARYDQDYAQPARVLRALTNRNTPASEAFKAVYGSGDPTIFQTAIRIAKDRPAFQNRLRLGFLEALNDEAGGFAQGKKAVELLRQNRQTVAATGLFTPPELDALELALRPGVIGRMSEALGHIVSRQPRAAFKALGVEGPIGLAGGAAAAAHLAGADPSMVLMAAMAGGASGAIRTIAHTPPGSTASIAAARSVAKAVADIAKQYHELDAQDADFGEGSDNE